MTDHLILHISSDGHRLLAAGLVSDAGAWLCAIAVADINRETDAYRSVNVVLVGTEAPSYTLDVPPLSYAKLVKIMPNLMADRIATNADTVHFPLLGQPKDGRVVVGVVDQSVMHSALALCADHGLILTRMVPDYMTVLPAAKPVVAEGAEGLVYVRYPDGHGCTVERDLADSIFGADADVQKVSVTASSWQEGLSRVPFLSENLLQGAFSPVKSFGSYFVLLRRAVLLAVCLGAVWLASTLWHASSDYRHAEKLETEAEAIFQAAFPGVKRIVNMEAQARIAARQASGSSASVFLANSTALFRVLEALPGVYVETIRFDEARAEFAATLSFSGFSETEKFRSAMEKAGIDFVEGSSRQEQSRILTDIVLTGAVGENR